MRKFIKNLKNSIIWKILKILFTLVKWVVEIIIIGIAAIIITQRVTNSQKAFLGIRIFDVATGSMEPEYAVGDVLIVKEKDPSTIVVGDNIVYVGNVADYKGKIITHNVIEIEQNEEGEYLFHTKGIANTVEDPIVHEDQLYGIVVHNNKVLAFICKILLNKSGLYFFIVFFILYAFIEFVRAQGEKMELEREEEKQRKRLEQEKKLKKENKKPKKVEEQDEEELEDDIEEEVIAPKKRTSKTTTKKKVEEKVETEPEQETKKTTRKKATESKEKVESAELKTTRKKNAISAEKVEDTVTKATIKKKTASVDNTKNTTPKKATKKKSESTEKVGETTPKTTRKRKAKEE